MVLSARDVVCIFARNVRKHVDKSVFATNGSPKMTVIQTRNQAWNCRRKMMRVKKMIRILKHVIECNVEYMQKKDRGGKTPLAVASAPWLAADLAPVPVRTKMHFRN